MANDDGRMDTPLTRLLDIRHPILLAPMAMISGGRLAAAVSRAGGLGLIGGGYGDRAWLERQFALAEEAPVGVGFITWSLLRQPELLDYALAHRPKAVMLSFGDLAPFAAKIRKAGCRLIAQVQTVAQAREAVTQGAEILVAQGTEAGGHGASRATLPLVPAVVDAVEPVPVVAAGGIADGRGLAAALMLGASGALMGSRFYLSEESLAHPAAKSVGLSASGDDTIRSSVFDRLRDLNWPPPYTLRSLRNEMIEHWHDNPAGLDAVQTEERARFQAALEEGDFQIAPVILGEAVDLVRTIVPAGELVSTVAAEAVARIRRVNQQGLATVPSG